MGDTINLTCPDCWFEFVHEKIEDIIFCPDCGYEFYEESVGDD